MRGERRLPLFFCGGSGIELPLSFRCTITDIVNALKETGKLFVGPRRPSGRGSPARMWWCSSSRRPPGRMASSARKTICSRRPRRRVCTRYTASSFVPGQPDQAGHRFRRQLHRNHAGIRCRCPSVGISNQVEASTGGMPKYDTGDATFHNIGFVAGEPLQRSLWAAG